MRPSVSGLSASRLSVCLTVIGLSCLIGAQVQAQLPSHYQELSAVEKQSVLWKNISREPYESLPGLTSRLLLSALGSSSALNLKPTINTASDEMPEGRIKFIHTYASCAAVELVTTQNPYSGLFQSGAVGFARLGWAAPPEFAGYIPGMAVKFLVDGRPSVNIQVMNSLDGQGKNANYFAKVFSNSLKEPSNPILASLAGIFKIVTKNPFYLPVDHLASVDRFGHSVSPGSFLSPEVLQLVPRHREWIASSSTQDLRLALPKVRVNSILYDVYGVSKASQNGVPQLIGSLKLKSNFVNSAYCDKKLFFQHHTVEAAAAAEVARR